MSRALLLACIAASSLGCAQAPPPASASAGPSRDDWAKLTWEERHSEMTFLVLPNMARLFEHEEGKIAPDMTCRTCHGQDAEAVSYAMPHGLPALDPARMPDERSAKVRFMRETVTPTMADLLGVDRSRFTCFGCHPRAR